MLLTGMLTGCAPGLTGGDRQSDPSLDHVLVSDASVPAKQGLLYMAMQDAEVARQSATYAIAAEDTADAKRRIRNLLHALDPSIPGTPTVSASGETAFWPGTVYGLRRSVERIAEQMRALGSRYATREQVVTQAAQVESCAEETLSRIDRLASLGQQALAADSRSQMEPLLTEIDKLTQVMLGAPAAAAANACSLEDARQRLDQLELQLV